ncbi:MAG: GntR family transcriptional regulator [Sphingomonas bacterium]
MDEATGPVNDSADNLLAARRHPLRTLPEQIADDLGGEILRGAIARGTRLREMELSARYGVSRAPVREAIRLLARKGLADFTPRRGAFVTEMTTDRFVDIFNVVVMLLGMAVRSFTEQGDGEALAALGEDTRRLAAMAADPATTGAEFAFAAWRMSGRIARHCGSEATAELLSSHLRDTAWGTIWRHLPLDYATQERRIEIAAAYGARYEAVAAGDGERAERITVVTGLAVRDHAARILAKARGEALNMQRLTLYRL